MGASAAADAAEAAFDADDDSAEGVVVGVVTWQVFLVDYVVHARHLEHYGRTFAARHRAQPTSSRYACRTAEHVAALHQQRRLRWWPLGNYARKSGPPRGVRLPAPPQCYGRPQSHDVVYELAAELDEPRDSMNRAPVRLPV